jgi:hypothetical protein
MLSLRSQFALLAIMQRMLKAHPGRVQFVTLTLPGGGAGLSHQAFARIWRSALRSARSLSILAPCGIRVWERHQSGGWHVHLLLGDNLLSERLTLFLQSRGWGRITVQPVIDVTVLAGYLSNEMAKSRQKDFSDCKRVRQWASWGCCKLRCSDIGVVSDMGNLLAMWPVLDRRARFRVLCALKNADSKGYLPQDRPLSRWKQWRAVVRCRRDKSNIALEGVFVKVGIIMVIRCNAEYRGQRFESVAGIVNKGTGAIFTKRNKLLLTFESHEDGVTEGFQAIMFLPDGEILEPAALAQVGQICALSVSKFESNYKGTSCTVASVVPCTSPAKPVGKPRE